MFASNQKLSITGETKKGLRKALDFIMLYNGNEANPMSDLYKIEATEVRE